MNLYNPWVGSQFWKKIDVSKKYLQKIVILTRKDILEIPSQFSGLTFS